MPKIWYRAIQKGLKTVEEVPERYKKEVQALLDKGE